MTANRIIIKAELEPIGGSRFQPTGFPDLGAAEFDRPVSLGNGEWGSESCLLVESNQSMANRLEGTLWDEGMESPIELIKELPWIKVVAKDDGRYLTSSRTEAHRLASAFVKQSTIDDIKVVDFINTQLQLRDDTPLAPRLLAKAVFALDPLCLIHGVFFADREWPGQPRIARAITGSIEAIGVEEAVSGGVKRDHVRHSLGEVVGGTAEGYGSVPFHRVEYTARQIFATFVIDLAQLQAYGLPPAATKLLENLALLEIVNLLDGGLRLRTACDFDVKTMIRGELPDRAELEDKIAQGIEQCSDLIAQPGARTVIWAGAEKKAARK
jgi:CRISPR-associated protein Csb1